MPMFNVFPKRRGQVISVTSSSLSHHLRIKSAILRSISQYNGFSVKYNLFIIMNQDNLYAFHLVLRSFSLWFKYALAYLLRGARHALHDILLLRTSAIRRRLYLGRRLDSHQDEFALLATYRGGSLIYFQDKGGSLIYFQDETNMKQWQAACIEWTINQNMEVNKMSDLAATNCSCGSSSNYCSNIIWILLLLCCCGNNNGLNFCDGGNGCGMNSCWIIILLLFCCNGGNSGCGIF